MDDGQSGQRLASNNGLYARENEHDSCGVGFVVNINGERSQSIVKNGIAVLKNMSHRGASGGDGKTGDGAGILTQIPYRFLKKKVTSQNITIPAEGLFAVGVMFLPSNKEKYQLCKKIAEHILSGTGLDVVGWRKVPVNSDVLGNVAKDSEPVIEQVLIGSTVSGAEFERKLYLARRQIEKTVEKDVAAGDSFYICSMSSRTVIYKGMMMGIYLGDYYPDLSDSDYESSIAIVHERYSTNTFPSWKLAQPFRYLAHNGEINTLRGNINQMKSRQYQMRSVHFGDDFEKLLPVIDETGSDSSSLDNVVEMLTACGRDLPHAMMMLVPQAWGKKYPIGPDQRGFFEYNAGLMEPWDGPAALAFTDGSTVGALLDRNGLRPSRYTILKSGLMVLASEAGVLELDPSDVIEKGSLRPGQMIIVDTVKRRIIKDAEIKAYYTRKQPYRRWVEENKISLHGLFNDVSPVQPDTEKLLLKQKMFGYSREDLQTILNPMAATGNEPVGSMGFDAPLAVLSEKPQLLYAYFKQLFAQVTNPPIDSIREELVMSIMTFMGNPANILNDDPRNCHLIKLEYPIMSNEDLGRLLSMKVKHFIPLVIKIGFKAGGDAKELEAALERIAEEAMVSARKQRTLVILSDRNLDDGMMPIPALLAVSAVNRKLVDAGVRTSSSIIIETGEAREIQHIVLLLGYGATAVNPYLAFETISDMAIKNQLDVEVDVAKAIENYIKALCKGILKIMSKMGISTLRSYRGAQVFEAIGLNPELIAKYFRGTVSRIGGIGLEEIAGEVNKRYSEAIDRSVDRQNILPSGGQYKYRNDGERHLWTPEAIAALQQATRNNDRALFRRYSQLINDQSRRQTTLRGLFKFRQTGSVPIDEVEPVEEIMKRFVTSAMSFGSISKETHETLAVAMNRIGARSNSGEGGEDPDRYKISSNGEDRCSSVKQVASGRFGVTIEYLNNAKELQIKIAQGAKPGEGGQLPGYKVNQEIARVRHSIPGVTLISPPPHHDIYSIEDIKQLIFDLKNANPGARISVKLVSEVGVGTVAAGVAKGKADMVLISGYDGGTGASPLSSIKYAGIPWELGLSETQQTLVMNDLRGRIRVQADGQMKTGRDVVIAALLGAEEYGFGTTVLVVCGCVMMRKCHQNTCPVGVATQNPELRKRFAGKPEYVINFFRMVAEEVREYMAELGFRRIDDMIGRPDLLEMNDAVDFWKAKGLDFSKIFARPSACDKNAVRCIRPQDHEVDHVIDRKLIEESIPAIESRKRVKISMPIRNTNRSIGTMLSGEIARKYGLEGLPENTITCSFRGSAGQSFGAFGAKGLTLILEGESNDYLGKGLSGARIIVKPFENAAYEPSGNIICGNVLLYGATSGEVYIYGRTGERFAIRNSGSTAVVEGIGDHGCEYMTGGRVAILGTTGVNFGAGMSGGIAYVFDEDRQFEMRCNLDMIDLELVNSREDIIELEDMIRKHYTYTGSKKAEWILDNFESCLPSFIKVLPMEYRRALGMMMREDESTEREEVVHG